jgi:hypothetical protein
LFSFSLGLSCFDSPYSLISSLLQGVFNETDGFLLTDPVIHSVDPKESHPDGNKIASAGNGKTDKGAQGIRLFFETHKCNALCQRLGLASELAPSSSAKSSQLSAQRSSQSDPTAKFKSREGKNR